MSKLAKKMLSLLLVASMLFSFAAPLALAADDDTGGGTGGTSGGGTSPGAGETTRITLTIGVSETWDNVVMPESGGAEAVTADIPKGVEIGMLPSPEKYGYLFRGWYYDEDCTMYAYPGDIIDQDELTLYAGFTSRRVVSTDDASNVVVSMDLKQADFSFVVTTTAPELSGAELAYQEIMGQNLGGVSMNWTPSLIMEYAVLKEQNSDTRLGMDVTDNGGGVYTITAMNGFTPGRLYQLDLSGAQGLYHVWNGETQPNSVIYHNMSLYREEVMNVALEEDIIFISVDDVADMGELEPLLTVEAVTMRETSENVTKLEEAIAQGATENFTTKSDGLPHEGSFVYQAPYEQLPQIGDTVCIYSGERPSADNMTTDSFLAEGEATYVVIDEITDGFTFHYHTADPADVLDMPIVVPLDAAADLNKNDGSRITLPEDSFYFDPTATLPFLMDGASVTYGTMGLDGTSTVRVGDYLALYEVYDGYFVSAENMQNARIVRITGMSTMEVTDDNGNTQPRLVVNYVESSAEEVENRLAIHATQPYDIPEEFIDEHKDEVLLLAREQFEEMDEDAILLGVLMSEEASDVLAANEVDLENDLFLTDENVLLNAELMGMEPFVQLDEEEIRLLADSDNQRVTVELKHLDFDGDIYSSLTHFRRKGVGFDGSVIGQIEITVKKATWIATEDDPKKAQEGQGKITIDFTVELAEEIWMDTDIDVDIETVLGFIPVGIEVDAGVTVGSWTHLGSTIRVTTGYEDDPWGVDSLEEDGELKEGWKKFFKETEDGLGNLKDALDEREWNKEHYGSDDLDDDEEETTLVEDIQKYFSDEEEEEEEEEDNTPDNLSGFELAYKSILEGVDDSWVKLINLKFVDQKIYDALHIVCLKLEIGFNLEVCGTIELGLSYDYEYARRYGVVLDVFDGDFHTSTTDVQTPHSTFMAYAIGVFGVKPSLYIELAVGLVDTDLDSVGIVVEAGIPIILYLYGILTIDSWRDESLQFQGGLYMTIAFELSIGLEAQIGKGVLSASKEVYSLTVPIVDVGARYQIRGWAARDKNGKNIMLDTMEVSKSYMPERGYIDILPEDRVIYALDMQTGEVVQYIPEADEFTYEIIPRSAKSTSTNPEGKILYFASEGESEVQQQSDWGNLGGVPDHDNSKVHTYERVYLDDARNFDKIIFDLTIKMTYNPPDGVAVAGRQYTKILNVTVNQRLRACIISYGFSKYNYYEGLIDSQRGAQILEGTKNSNIYDPNFPIEYIYLPGEPVKPESQPENNPYQDYHVVGYTVTGWKPYVLRNHYYNELQGRQIITDKDPYSQIKIGYDLYSFVYRSWFDQGDPRSASSAAPAYYTLNSNGTKNFVNYDSSISNLNVNESIRYEAQVIPNQQTLKVRHWVRNVDINGRQEDGYYLVSESELTNEETVSDFTYNYEDAVRWGVAELNETDLGVIDPRSSFTIKVTQNYPSDKPTVRNLYNLEQADTWTYTHWYYWRNFAAIITPTDSETPVDVLDVYYEARTKATVHAVAVDENGVEIPTIGEQVGTYTVVAGLPADLPTINNDELRGYVFDGWYDTTERDALPEYTFEWTEYPGGNRSRTRYTTTPILTRDITVKYKVKPVPMAIAPNLYCENDGAFITQLPAFNVLPGEYTIAELLEQVWGERALKDLFPADRPAADSELSRTIVLGGTKAADDTAPFAFDLDVKESTALDNVKLRIVLQENGLQPKVEGETTIFYEEILEPGDYGCGMDFPDLEDYAWTPAGWDYQGIYLDVSDQGIYDIILTNQWNWGQRVTYTVHREKEHTTKIPGLSASLLEDETNIWSYDEATNTLTATFYVDINPGPVPYQVVYHYLDKDGETELDTVTKELIATADSYVDIKAPKWTWDRVFHKYDDGKVAFEREQVYHEILNGVVEDAPIGYELQLGELPYSALVKGDGSTVIDVNYIRKEYDVQFVLKHPLTGEIIRQTEMVQVAAGDTYTVPDDFFTANSADMEFAGFRLQGWSNGKTMLAIDEHNTVTGSELEGGVYEALYNTYDVKVYLDKNDIATLYISDKNYNTSKDVANYVRTIRTHKEFELPTPVTTNDTVFLGWYDNPDFTGDPITGTLTITEDVTFYAKYVEAITMTVNMNDDDRDPACVESKTIKVRYQRPMDFLEDSSTINGRNRKFVRDNYTLIGWNTDPDATEPLDLTTVYADPSVTTYYAIYEPNTYRVEFVLGGGSWNQTSSGFDHVYSKSTTVAPTETPTRTGYIFKGWSLNGTVFQPEDIQLGPYDVTQDCDYFAVWEAIPYKITYVVNGGTMPDSYATTWSFDDPVWLCYPHRFDGGFSGWYTDDETFTDRVDYLCNDGKNHFTEPGDVTLYAKWTFPTYPIIASATTPDGKGDNGIAGPSGFDSSIVKNAVPGSYQVTDGVLTLPELDDTDAWAFDHWEIHENSTWTTVTEIDFGARTGQLFLYAVYTPIYYSISYDYDGGTPGEGEYVTQLQTNTYIGTLTSPKPTKEGYSFRGWIIEETGEYLGSWFQETQDITLKASWYVPYDPGEYEPDKPAVYNVNYYIPDGQGGYTELTAKAQTGVETFDNPISVLGLFSEAGFTDAEENLYRPDYVVVNNEGRADGDGYIPVGGGLEYTFDLYCDYQQYTVEFDAYDAAMGINPYMAEPTLILHYDDVIPVPADPVCPGFAFNGWDTELSSSTTVADLYTQGSIRTISIHANAWSKATYSITYSNWPEGVTNPNPTSYQHGDDGFFVALPENCPGIELTPIYVDTENGTSDLTVEIAWAKPNYRIAYDLGGVNSSAEFLTAYSADTKAESYLLPQLTRDGYTFDGWTVDGEAVTRLPIPGVYEDYTVKANWTAIEYKLLVDLKGGTIVSGENPAGTFTAEDVAAGKIIDLPILEKEGYSFLGWELRMQSNDERRNLILLNLSGKYSNLLLTARFALSGCSITYVMNDDGDTTYPANNRANYDTFFTPRSGETLVIREPSRLGYTFDGWTCDQNLGTIKAGSRFSTLILDESNALPAITLTAHWRVESAKIKYNLNGGTLETTKSVVTSKTAGGNLVAAAGTLTNPEIYSIVNSIELEDPVKLDENGNSITFLGWTSDAFGVLEMNSNVLGRGYVSTEELISTAEAEALLNCANDQITWYWKQQGVSMTAVWADKDYRIYCLLNGGTLPEGASNPETYRNTDEDITLVNPVRQGYTFLGWQQIGSDAPLSTNVTIESGSYGDVTYEAKWSANSYTITYDLGGGVNNGLPTTVFDESQMVLKFGEPELAGCNFDYWTITNADTDEVILEKYDYLKLALSEEANPEAYLCNLKLTAHWVKFYSHINVYTNGGKYPEGESHYVTFYPADDAKVLIKDPLPAPGYHLSGYTSANVPVTVTPAEEDGYHYVEVDPWLVKWGSDVQILALWEENDPIEYTVNCYINSDPAATEYELDETVTLSAPGGSSVELRTLADEQSKAMLDRMLEASMAESTVYVGGEQQTLSDSVCISEEGIEINLYFIRISHTVTYIGADMSADRYYMGDALVKPADPMKTGSSFGGWFTDIDCTIPFDFEGAVMGTEDIYLYPKWTMLLTYYNWPESIPNPNPTEATLDTEGFYVQYPAMNPQETGYYCGGLTDEELLTATFFRNPGVTGNVETLWEPYTFTITYPDDADIEYQGDLTDTYTIENSVLLPTPGKDGLNFQKWVATANGSEITLEGSKAEGFIIPEGTVGDITLEAVFTDGYSVTYLGLEGSNFETNNPNPDTYTLDGEQVDLQNPEKPGYYFDHWSVVTEDGDWYAYTLPTGISGVEDVVLTANWNPISYEIKLYDQSGYCGFVRYDADEANAGIVELWVNTPEGCTLTGWTVYQLDEYDEEIGEPITLGADGILPAGTYGNLKAVAMFEEATYTIEYELNDGEFETTAPTSYTPSDVAGSAYVEVPEPVKEGYTFDGWTVWVGEYYDPTVSRIESVLGNVKLEANWRSGSAMTYTVTWEGFGVANVDELPTSYDGTKPIALPELVSMRGEGYIGTWVVYIKDGYNYLPVTLTGGSIIPAGLNGNLVIDVEWEEAPTTPTYTISYETAASVAENSADFPTSYDGTTDVVLPEPMRTGYTGTWSVFSLATYSDIELANGNTIPAGTTGNLIVNVVWTEDSGDEPPIPQGDAIIAIYDENDTEFMESIASVTYSAGTLVTAEMLLARLPEGTDYETICYQNGDPFESCTVSANSFMMLVAKSGGDEPPTPQGDAIFALFDETDTEFIASLVTVTWPAGMLVTAEMLLAELPHGTGDETLCYQNGAPFESCTASANSFTMLVVKHSVASETTPLQYTDTAGVYSIVAEYRICTEGAANVTASFAEALSDAECTSSVEDGILTISITSETPMDLSQPLVEISAVLNGARIAPELELDSLSFNGNEVTSNLVVKSASAKQTASGIVVEAVLQEDFTDWTGIAILAAYSKNGQLLGTTMKQVTFTEPTFELFASVPVQTVSSIRLYLIDAAYTPRCAPRTIEVTSK